MIIIGLLWENSWIHPKHELLMWRDCTALGADKVIAVPKLHKSIEEYDTMDELLKKYKNFKKVFVENRKHPQRQIIYDYEHPKGDVLYLFGKSNTNNLRYVKPGDDVLYVPIKKGNIIPWPLAICGIVLYDRQVKQWRSQ